jgi:Uma2 family endonuclease
MVVRKPLLKPDDVERMVKCGEIEPDKAWELIDGEIVWLSPANPCHAEVVATLAALLYQFVRGIGGRLLAGDSGFVVGANRDQLRGADVALVSHERAHILTADSTWGSEAPDLAVEVLSPDQRGEAYVRPKVAEYLAAGAKVVWLVDPDARTIRVYEPNRDDYAVYSADADIDLDRIAPGFSARVASFFP